MVLVGALWFEPVQVQASLRPVAHGPCTNPAFRTAPTSIGSPREVLARFSRKKTVTVFVWFLSTFFFSENPANHCKLYPHKSSNRHFWILLTTFHILRNTHIQIYAPHHHLFCNKWAVPVPSILLAGPRSMALPYRGLRRSPQPQYLLPFVLVHIQSDIQYNGGFFRFVSATWKNNCRKNAQCFLERPKFMAVWGHVIFASRRAPQTSSDNDAEMVWSLLGRINSTNIPKNQYQQISKLCTIQTIHENYVAKRATRFLVFRRN